VTNSQRSVQRWRVADLPRERVADHLERTAVRMDGALAVFNWMEPRPTSRPPHEHPFDQLSLVLDGEMEFSVEGEVLQVAAGEVLVIPPSARHTARTLGARTSLSLDIFAPARADYLHLADHQQAPAAEEDSR
jgi:mannose-6-phosphate isomerase-like protein (cupin superfamily)